MKKALIFYGGWNGHTPKETAMVFEEMLKEEGFCVTVSDTMDILNSYDNIADIDLFVPVWTMGEISNEQSQNILKAISEGAGIAGCHGGIPWSVWFFPLRRDGCGSRKQTGSGYSCLRHPVNQAQPTVQCTRDCPRR